MDPKSQQTKPELMKDGKPDLEAYQRYWAQLLENMDNALAAERLRIMEEDKRLEELEQEQEKSKKR
ncbi:hypothetical protein N7520_006189 [Penicillium odoratum]|uniref:uncharacterized protein n=1 Tax=Penicillium odoratum TaxID=1167516 RepID=UPI0025473430|nr:uncharacterized protein N7520_006189 [Penicillium odoratum]KAJ5759033.1 hypothetical protein N7520_006189 [Penicillium odoratum]